jgi:Helix-turn-helix domain
VSIQAYSWAIEQDIVQDHTTQLVLMCLAYYAGVDGLNAFPSVKTLATRARLTERGVQKALRRLIGLGLLEEGNPAIVAAHIQRSDRRPKTYNLIMSRGEPRAPRRAHGVNLTPDGVNLTPERGEYGSPNPTQRSEGEPKKVTREQVEREIAARFGHAVADLARQKRGPKH